MTNRLSPTRIEPYFCAHKVLGEVSRVKQNQRQNCEKQMINTQLTDTFTSSHYAGDSNNVKQLSLNDKNKTIFNIFSKNVAKN